MTATRALATLADLMDDEGCLPSVIRYRDGRVVPDRNGFVTALVLRTLRHAPRTAEWHALTTRGLAWVLRCRSTAVPGAFGFWPETARPGWAAGLPPDADDTAVATAELYRHGRLTRLDVVRTVCRALLPSRVDPGDGRPPWVAPGSFRTWLGPASAANPVDCCVNANVAALLALVDATHLPGFAAAVATVHRGLDWAGTDPVRLSALTPFYPDPRSLADALAHAVESGAEPLRAAARHTATLAPPGPAPGCFRSAYGHDVWHADALDVARAAGGERGAGHVADG